jgi:hypothetical protein
MSGDDAGRIRQSIEKLSKAAMRIGEAEQRSAQTDRGAGGTAGPAADRVVDAEFEDVDDPKRRAPQASPTPGFPDARLYGAFGDSHESRTDRVITGFSSY